MEQVDERRRRSVSQDRAAIRRDGEAHRERRRGARQEGAQQHKAEAQRASGEAERDDREGGRRSPREFLDALIEVVTSHPGISCAILVIAILLAVMYGPARDYYIACRRGQYLRAYYSEVVAQNNELTHDTHYYLSEEGIVDEAHRRGYAREDETSVVVEGAPEDEDVVALSDIEIDTNPPLYIKVLDVLFFYKEGVTL